MNDIYLVYGQDRETEDFFLSGIFAYRFEADRRCAAFWKHGLKAYVRTEELLTEHQEIEQ